MRIPFRVCLHRCRHSAIGIAFTQDRIHGAAEHFRIASAELFFGIVFRLFRIIRQIVALRLEFTDGGCELRNRCADIRQLDDVRAGCLREFTQFGERVTLFLVVSQPVRETGNDSPGQ